MQSSAPLPAARWSPWRFIVWFGIVSMLCDVVYEGARSTYGPFLASLGASAAMVGLITGVGEAAGLAGRLVSGQMADRTRAYWPLAIGGYAVTIVCVTLTGVSSILWIVAILVIGERAGKALRSPAKDVMISSASSTVGRGKGFGMHEALDQIGAFVGPILVAAVLASTGRYLWAFGVLAIPGAIALAILFWMKREVPDPGLYEPGGVATKRANQATSSLRSLPRAFWWYLTFTAISASGFATWGVIGYHLAERDVFSDARIPIVYAIVMAIDAVAALAGEFLFDMIDLKSLLAVPICSALIPAFAFSTSIGWVWIGVALWGIVLGIQESTMRAAIGEMVPSDNRGTAYGVFAAGFGVATLVGGFLSGALYDVSLPALIAVVIALEAIAFALLIRTLRIPIREA